MPEKVNLNAYFERIGFAGSIAPSLATLEQLHALHPASIPYENLDPLMGKPIALDQPSLERKLLFERRGGHSFEQNLLFMRMLADLDYSVRPVLARGLWRNPGNQERGHCLLLVELSGQNHIADVGHGGLTLTAPIRLRADVEQPSPHETYRLLNNNGEWTLEARIGEDWRPVYAFKLDPVSDAEINAANQSVTTDPHSPLTDELRVARAIPGKRLKLHNTTLTIQPGEGEVETREIASLEALRSVLTDDFGITLPDDERLHVALSGLFPLAPDTPDQAPV